MPTDKALIAYIDERVEHIYAQVRLGANLEEAAAEQSKALLTYLSKLKHIDLTTITKVSNHLQAQDVWSRSQFSAFNACLRLHQPGNQRRSQSSIPDDESHAATEPDGSIADKQLLRLEADKGRRKRKSPKSSASDPDKTDPTKPKAKATATAKRKAPPAKRLAAAPAKRPAAAPAKRPAAATTLKRPAAATTLKRPAACGKFDIKACVKEDVSRTGAAAEPDHGLNYSRSRNNSKKHYVPHRLRDERDIGKPKESPWRRRPYRQYGRPSGSGANTVRIG